MAVVNGQVLLVGVHANKPVSMCSDTTGSKELKEKFNSDTRVKEAFLQVVFEEKSQEDKFQELLTGNFHLQNI